MDDQHQAGPDHGGGSVSEDGPVPLGQRLFDSPFLLLIACKHTEPPIPDYVQKTQTPPFRPPEPSKKKWP